MTAQEWADTVEETGADPDLTAVAAVIRSTPEPKFMLADVPVDERDQYIGCAAKVDEVRGWLESLPDEDEYCATITYYDGVLRWRDAEPYEVELLPDEPRMTAPGVTPEPEPEPESVPEKKPEQEQRVLETTEDFDNAPEGTIVERVRLWETEEYAGRVAVKVDDRWQAQGYTPFPSVIAREDFAPAAVIRWGKDKWES